MVAALQRCISGGLGGRPGSASGLALCIFAVLFLIAAPVGAQARRNVLILNSYHHGLGWSDSIVRGILSGLPEKADYSIEYMDTKRFTDPEPLEILAGLYKRKYGEASIDVIVSCDDNALRFLVERHGSLFPGVPVVFCGVNHLEDVDIEGKPLFTGVEEKLYQGKSLQAALALHPGAKGVAFITDSTTSGRGNRRNLGEIAKTLPERLKIAFLDESLGLTREQLLETVRTLPQGTIVYYSDFFVDGAGRFVDYEEFMPRLAAASPNPIYAHGDMYLGLGIVGGHLVSGFHQGAKAAEMARRILDGESPAGIPIEHESPNMYMFDYAQLERFGIDPKALPPDSIVVNKPFSFFARYKTMIWIVALAFVVQSAAIIALIVINLQRKRARKALQESEEKYRLLFENAPVGVIRSTPGGRYVSVNPEFARIIGYGSPEEVCREITDIAAQLYVDPGDRQRLGRLLDERGEVKQQEYRLRHKDGGVVWVSATVRAIRGDDGRTVLYDGFISDVTERRTTQEELLKAKEDAEAANRAKSEFLANMSHELRTPLNGIMGMLQLMQTTPLNEEQEEYAVTAINSSERLTRLLSDILDLSRVEAGKLSLKVEPFDLHEAVRQVCDLFQITSMQTGVSLNCDIDPGVPGIVLGDFTRLQQVLNNLVGNAFKFTSSGGIAVKAHRLPCCDGKACRVLFSVSDTGIGIPDQKLEMLMEPFTQASEGYARRHQGAGLGLAICKRLVALMGGGISVDSELKKGSTFYFSVTLGLAGQMPESAEAAIAGKETPRLPCSVLLAEDDRVSSYSTKRLLEKAGCSVMAVGDGREVLEALRNGAFDVVLMDVQLPAMDGVEATKAIRQGLAGKDKEGVPIVALTAYAMAGDREKFLAVGMDDYLSKPVDMGPLLKALGKLTGHDLPLGKNS